MIRKKQKQTQAGATEKSVAPVGKIDGQVAFEHRTDAGADVYVVGSFNDWDPTRNRLRDNNSDGCYRTSLLLVPGRYEYKFVVNGRWCIDPKCPDPVVNRYGTLNGVVTVAGEV